MTTKNDSKSVTEITSTDSQQDKPRLSLRRERVKVLASVRTSIRTGWLPRCGGCIEESIEV